MLRVLEILFFAIVNYVPYVPIGFWPFRNNLRFSKKVTYTIIFLQICIVIANHFAVEFGLAPEIATAITTITSISILFLIDHDNLGKMVMTLLIIQNYAILIMYLAEYIETLLLPDTAGMIYTWSQAGLMLFWQIIILTLIVVYMRKVYIAAISTVHDKTIWRFLWIIPATFYVVWQFYISQYEDLSLLPLKERTSVMLMLLIISIGSGFIYHMTSMLLLERVRSESFEVQNRTMQFQYENIQERIAEAKRNRHDIRHHLVLIDQYLQDGKYEECKQYLDQYRSSLPYEEALTYCEHYATNALITYMEQLARDYGIKGDVKINYPKDLPFATEDLTIVFANLVENALDACKEIVDNRGYAETPMIRIVGTYQAGRLLFQIENPVMHIAKQNENGVFISNKHEGNGIGIESVKAVVEKYEGSCDIRQENHTFKVRVLMEVQQ